MVAAPLQVLAAGGVGNGYGEEEDSGEDREQVRHG
jgi:hypothetical protein